jgi:sugar lactone lactonase YvrE
VVLEGVTESNGLGWSLDGSVAYYVDSGEPVVRRYAYDQAVGTFGQRLADLAVLTEGEGVPDGLVVDAAGAVWVALWEGGAVRQYAPDGELLRHLPTPVSRPTCPGFAGPGLDVLVVTSAWEGMGQAERHAELWAGHLLTAPVGAVGCLPHRYGGGPR